MSSTTGFQNLLVNVFRPVYTYDATTTTFTPKLEMSNIDTYSGNTVSVFTAAVGDANSNVYVGSNAGNSYLTLKACRYVSAFGYGAAEGISNVSNSVFVGFNAGTGAAGATNNVIIGDNATGNGFSNVRIGSSSSGTGSSNVSIGASTNSVGYSNCILLGPAITATQNNQFRVGSNYLYGNMGTKWLGVGTSSPYDANNKLDVSGNAYFLGQVGINEVPVRTLDVNGDFRTADAYGSLDFNTGSFTVTADFKRTLSSTAITQPIIQYGKLSSSGGSGNTTVTLPTAYSDTSYVVQVTMQDATAAEMSADIVSSNSFTIYWQNAGGGSHTIGWTTFGT